MSESKIKPVAGKPILTQSDMDNGLTEDVILLGIDLGTSRSSVVALNGVRKTIDSYVGYPKDAVSRKMLKTDVLYGKAALDNQLALNLYRPLEKGVIKGTYEGEGASVDEGKKNLTAAQDLIRHLVDLVNPGRDQLIYGVVGVPAQATGKNKTAIIEITKDIFDSVMIVSEPFTVAYGMERMSDILVIDIGAGTTDLCRMHGTVPGPDDEISFTIAGDAVDAKLLELIRIQYPKAQLTQNMCKGFKELYGYVSDTKDKIEVMIPVDGKPTPHDITNVMKQACEILVDPIVAGCNIARTIEATIRLEYLPKSEGDRTIEWESALNAAGSYDGFMETHKELDEESAVEYMTFDRTNPSSICNCLENARSAGRAVRTALTAETWAAINDAWLELKRFEASHRLARPLDRLALARFLDYVKKASLDFDGACYRTMLRNDAYWFNRLGIFIERADNTARLLDVKYHLLLPSTEPVGGSLDYFQWVAILRAVSAATSYHWVYRDRVKPWLIADLLILKRAMPRSLISCYESIDRALDSLARDDGRSGVAQRQARGMHAKLERSSMTEIFQGGLHEFITAFIDDNARLSTTISEQYLFT